MPTQSTTYNSRVTDEALEKRFRDTFRAQGGAELVDDLYAQGVIVPVVDFTQAATGQTLSQSLQEAWDFTTGHASISNTTTNLITTAGFWKVDLTFTGGGTGAPDQLGSIDLTDGLSSRELWEIQMVTDGTNDRNVATAENSFIVFLRAGDTLSGTTNSTGSILNVWYRQVATVSGDLVDPSGFTSS